MTLRDSISRWNYWKVLRAALVDPKVDDAALEAALQAARARTCVPVVWLLGKAQAGKTSIIHALTGSAMAHIGNGFQACTRTARLYDFPAETPVVRFLDTRGLGEVAYDPTDDIRYCEAQANLVLAVIKVGDARQDAVFEVLHAVRSRHPDWPLVIAQTGLHELYPAGTRHVLPYPFGIGAGADSLPVNIPGDLRRALALQRARIADLAGAAGVHWVAIDLTLPEDGFDPGDYGLDALWGAIETASSFGLQQQLCGDAAVRDLYARTAHPHIVGYAITAAGLGALPFVDLVAVTTVQAKLLHSLAALYRQRWERRTISEFFGLLGAGLATGLVAQMAARSVAKLIPIWGHTAGAVWGASASAASTYALGKAAVYFFARRRDGLAVDSTTLRHVYHEALDGAATVLKDRFRAGPQ